MNTRTAMQRYEAYVEEASSTAVYNYIDALKILEDRFEKDELLQKYASCFSKVVIQPTIQKYKIYSEASNATKFKESAMGFITFNSAGGLEGIIPQTSPTRKRPRTVAAPTFRFSFSSMPPTVVAATATEDKSAPARPTIAMSA